ncbi:mechanosensitive ion channel family protein [Haladaptatus sp. DFWS20]|uniref:mechanosensitive ion channel family protein n=1 Tax=Haladaptatus sp. DFWS20 TaxID=3403467 RepID=UPI003EC10D44
MQIEGIHFGTFTIGVLLGIIYIREEVMVKSYLKIIGGITGASGGLAYALKKIPAIPPSELHFWGFVIAPFAIGISLSVLILDYSGFYGGPGGGPGGGERHGGEQHLGTEETIRDSFIKSITPIVLLFGSAIIAYLAASIFLLYLMSLTEVQSLLPRIAGAIVILLLGWALGRVTATVVRRIADQSNFDRIIVDSLFGRVIGRSESAILNALGKLTAWFIYVLAILTAADVLAIQVLSEWIAMAVSYFPALIAGSFIIVFGFYVADFIGDLLMRTRAAAQSYYMAWFAAGTRIFLYFTVMVIGLDTIGFDVQLLYIFARALVWGIAIAAGIAVGIAVGWGSHVYVAENVEYLMGQGQQDPGGSTAQPSDD